MWSSTALIFRLNYMMKYQVQIRKKIPRQNTHCLHLELNNERPIIVVKQKITHKNKSYQCIIILETM